MYSSSENSPKSDATPIPALRYARSMPPNSAMHAAKAASICAESETSAVYASPPISSATALAASPLMSTTQTRIPSATRRRAAARPIPEPPPVTSATRPLSSMPLPPVARAALRRRGDRQIRSLGSEHGFEHRVDGGRAGVRHAWLTPHLDRERDGDHRAVEPQEVHALLGEVVDRVLLEVLAGRFHARHRRVVERLQLVHRALDALGVTRALAVEHPVRVRREVLEAGGEDDVRRVGVRGVGHQRCSSNSRTYRSTWWCKWRIMISWSLSGKLFTGVRDSIIFC